MKPSEFLIVAAPIIMIVSPYLMIKILSGYFWRIWCLRFVFYSIWTVVLFPVFVALLGVTAAAVNAISINQENGSVVKSAVYIPNETNDKYVQLPYTKEPRLTGSNANPVPYKGTDYATFCGDILVAPQNGTVKNVGIDRYCGQYGCYNTFIEFENDSGIRTVLLHGDYILGVGDAVERGITTIGYEASNGNSTGCHTDFWTNGQMVSINDNPRFFDNTNGKKAGKPLKLSWYDPDLGGINCSPPCDMMASGAMVTEVSYGHVAACIPEWMGGTVIVDGYGEFKCLDTGGAIKEYSDYIWIDLLLHGGQIPNGPHVAFGTLVYDWEFVWK